MTVDDAKREVEGNGGHMLPENFDGALLGAAAMPFQGPMYAVYSLAAMAKTVADEHGWSEEEGMEWVSYNVVGSSTPEQGPLFMVEVER